jgi:hypothetical protein
MSLLNDVLHDLERRTADKPVADVYPLFLEPPKTDVQPPRRHNKAWIAAVIGFAVAVGVPVFLWENAKQDIAGEPVQLAQPTTDSTAKINESAEAVESAIPLAGIGKAESTQAVSAPVRAAPSRMGAPSWPPALERRYRYLATVTPDLLAPEVVEVVTEKVKGSVAVVAPKQPEAAAFVIQKPDQKTLEVQALREAKNMAFKGERSASRARLRQFIGEYPNAIDARLVLVGWLIQDSDWQRASALLVSIDIQDDYRLRMQKARLLSRETRTADAIALLQGHQPPTEREPAYHAMHAALLLKDKRFAEATAVYSRLTKTAEPHGDWWGGLAVSLDQVGDKVAALDAYRRAVLDRRVNPDLRQFAVQRISILSRWEG